MIKSIKKYPFHWALLASLLLHVFFYFFTGMGITFLRLLQVLPAALASAPEERPKPPLVFEVVETPNSAQRVKASDNAKYASDKNAVAQNPEAPQDLPIGEPFSEGDLANGELHASAVTSTASENAGSQSSTQERFEAKQEKNAELKPPAEPSTSYNFSGPTFHRELLMGQPAPASQASSVQTVLRDHRNSRAPLLGSFSLDTYEWNFAPYMLWLKKRVQSNIYPPPAFTHMGLISGQTMLRFKIYRDGSLRDLELIDYRGHISLMQTSKRAIELSVPLQKLPPDFPKDYLEVTAQFDYTILNSHGTED